MREFYCPCHYVPPCSDSCTCANSLMSGGCQRCCRYGSEEQRRASAHRLVGVEAERLTPQCPGIPITVDGETIEPDDPQHCLLCNYEHENALVRREGNTYRTALETIASKWAQPARNIAIAALEQGTRGREGK